MSITSDLDTWWAEVDGYNDSNAAKAKFQDLMAEIDRNLDELAQMNTNGEFDKLPASWRTKAIWAWQQLDTARDTVKADAEFMEGINWTP
ncbi:MAG: hypothetical protein GWN00_34425 [Aliifodinibius sp.]|nr:hypothetical protein [Fodinibius sp.]NIY29699.1 hypothetical protein [Fodinibius sp.]